MQPNGLLGIATGFPTIDKATSGLQPEQLVTIIATPKTGKSVLAMQMAINAHELGATPMFQSFEMSNLEQQKRYDAIRSHISFQNLITGKLTPTEVQKYEAMLQRTAVMPTPFILTDSTSAMTVSTLVAKAEQVRPSMLFIDGVYLMVDEITGEMNSPQALTNITRMLKKAAQKLHIPVVITTQALPWKMKKNQVTADAIGYSSSFYQDSDVILGLQKDETNDLERLLKIVGSRNTGYAEANLKWDWTTGEFEELAAVMVP
jgi:replicative DNA helicase